MYIIYYILYIVYLGATPSFHRLLSRPVALGIPWDPWETLGDPLGTPWGPLWTSWGPLGDPLGPLGDLLGTLGDHLGTFGDVLGRLGHALAIPCGPLTSAFGYFRCLLGILWGQLGAPRGSHRLPKGVQEASWRSLGSLLRAFLMLRKSLRSNSLQYAKTFKFTVRYCKNRGPWRPNSLKIYCNSSENL